MRAPHSRMYGFSLVASLLIGASCSIVQPDHDFPQKTPHSYDRGSGKSDTLAVLAILSANDLPADKFKMVVETKTDGRIHGLNLNSLGIDTLPEAIGSMGALDKLNLSHNNLTGLPDSIITLAIFTTFPISGPCGSEDCGYSYLNGLSIDHNRLCSVPPVISAWIDSQFKQNQYLLKDTTQVCAKYR